MGTIKDRNGIDLTEAEDIKKRWQKYTEERSRALWMFKGIYLENIQNGMKFYPSLRADKKYIITCISLLR